MKLIICSSNCNIVEERVCIFSLISCGFNKNNIYIACSDNNKIYYYDRKSIYLELPEISYGKSTKFTFLRFFIPFLFHDENIVICDPDMIFLFSPIVLMNSSNINSIHMRKAYSYNKWASSFMYVNLDKDKSYELFNYAKFVINTHDGNKLLDFSGETINKLNIKIKSLPVGWNDFDFFNDKTKLIHFTNLLTQPWIFKNHPLEYLWFNFAKMAFKSELLNTSHIDIQANTKNLVYEENSNIRLDFDNLLYGKKNYFLINNYYRKVIQLFKDISFFGLNGYIFSKIKYFYEISHND